MTYHKTTACASVLQQKLTNANDHWRLGLDEVCCERILSYLDALLLWNKSYNLTAIDDVFDAFVKHILDCLAVLPHFDALAPKKTVLDIGTGAGLPAAVLAIARPNWHVTALDSNSKKIRFIRQMVAELSLTNLTPCQERIEQHSHRYDIVTSRAFASLDDFVTVAAPCLATDGVLMAMKGKVPEELGTHHQLKGWHTRVIALHIPELGSERCLVQLTKKGNL